MPIILMAVLFGLAMDYQVFLVSGMREVQVHTGNWRHAIEEGYAQGARVVTAAALIMFFVFFSFVPEGSNIIKPIALGLAVGIAFDAFIVRMTLVPALMALFGPIRLVATLLVSPEGSPGRRRRGAAARLTSGDSLWASEHPHLAVHAAYLTTPASDEPVSVEWQPGARVAIVGEVGGHPSRPRGHPSRGISEPVSGAVHVRGHALPGDARAVRQVVALWSSNDDDLLEPPGRHPHPAQGLVCDHTLPPQTLRGARWMTRFGH